jgi:hypothetical protein
MFHDALEVSAVASLAGFHLADELITRPPYSDPHHSPSVASIVGGGQRMAKPGAISCAHRAVLFLDDSTEPQSTLSVCLKRWSSWELPETRTTTSMESAQRIGIPDPRIRRKTRVSIHSGAKRVVASDPGLYDCRWNPMWLGKWSA